MYVIISVLLSLSYLVLSQYTFGNLPIVSDLSPQDCYLNNLTYIEPYNETGYIPRCGNFSSKNEGQCSVYFDPKKKIKLVNKPTCTKSGAFVAKQCKGEYRTGRCFCFDAQGNRLFGQEWWSKASNMTCACSRKKADMDGTIYFNSLHCDSVGNYEKLQCDTVSEQCWCVEEKTGELTSPVVPQVAIMKLPCYDSKKIGSRYLRQCENQKFARKTIEHQLHLRGTTSTYGEFLCDDDGAYGSYAITEGSAFCTWRDNSKISSYRSGDNLTTINCNCARDLKIYENAGKSMDQKCTSEGNYQTFQTSGDKGYCVDLDGYKKSFEEVSHESNCTKYAAYH